MLLKMFMKVKTTEIVRLISFFSFSLLISCVCFTNNRLAKHGTKSRNRMEIAF